MEWKQISITQGDSICKVQTTAVQLDGGCMVKVTSFDEFKNEDTGEAEYHIVSETVNFMPGYTIEVRGDINRLVRIRA